MIARLSFVVWLLCLFLPTSALSFNLKTVSAEGFPSAQNIQVKIVPLEAAPDREAPDAFTTFNGSAGDSFNFVPKKTLAGRPAELRVEFSEGAFHRPLDHSELEKDQLTLRLPRVEKPAEQDLEVVSHEIFYRPDTSSLAVREKIQLTNRGSGLAGGPGHPVLFDLPAAATDLRYGPGCFLADDVVFSGGRMKYRLFVAPGRTVLGFYYRLPISELPLRLRREVTLPTRELRISVPALQGLELNSEQLERKAGGEGAINLRATELKPGEKVELEWVTLGEKGSPPAVASASSPARGKTSTTRYFYSYLFWGAGGTLGLSLLLLIYFVVNYIFRESGPREKTLRFVESEIARLESAVKRGELDEAVKDKIVRRWKKFCREKLQ